MGVVIKLSIRLKVLKRDIKILRYWDIGILGTVIFNIQYPNIQLPVRPNYRKGCIDAQTAGKLQKKITW